MSGEGGYQPEVEESVELLPKAPKGGSGEKPFNPKPTGAMDEMREALEEVQTLLDEGLKNFQVKDTPIELIEAVGLVGIMLDRLALAKDSALEAEAEAEIVADDKFYDNERESPRLQSWDESEYFG